MKPLKVLLLLLSIICFFSSNATHIVGGVIYYTRDPSNPAKITLTFKIYRDCGGSSNAAFDGDNSNSGGGNQTAFYFGIYEGNQTVNALDPNSTGTDRVIPFVASSVHEVSSSINNVCLVKDGTCIQEATYTKQITLPSINVGYTIIHERCCRNADILNIDNIPNSTDKPGMGLRTYIPPVNTTPNNSAVFKSLPPVFICVNQTFYFDHSATDAENDQLRYFLIEPVAGLSRNKPVDPDQPLSGLSNITYKSPYSLADIIGGTPTMSIDSNTGLITCKPNTIGRFVFSVMCKEYRNGVVINSFAREIQVNVRECNIPNADMPFKAGSLDIVNGIADYPVECKDYTINFVNSSSNGSDVTYKWNFGDPASGANNTSTLSSPSHKFLDSGIYVVTLYAIKTTTSGQLCVDSTRRRVRIYPGYHSNFTFTSSCQGTPLQFVDKSTSVFGVVNKWAWDFGDGKTSTVQNASNIYVNPGTYNVKLISGDTKLCAEDTTITVTVYPKPIISSSNVNACVNQETSLNCNITVPSPYTITDSRWKFPNGTILNGCNQKYTFTSIGANTVNLLGVTDKGCRDSLDLTYLINPKPTIVASNDTTICYDQKTRISATGGVSYEWTPTNLLDNSNSVSPIASPIYPNTTKFIVKGIDAKGCFNFDSLNVSFYTKPFISAGLDTSVCKDRSSNKFKDSVKLNGQGSFNQVFWTPTIGLSNPNILNPTCKPLATTDYVLNAIDVNKCLVKDTVLVVVLDPSINLIAQNNTFMCYGDSLLLNPVDQGAVSSYEWSPRFWVSNPFIRNPVFKPLDTYLFILTVQNYCYSKSDSILINVNALPTPNMPNVDSICAGEIYKFDVGNFVSYNWAQDNTLSSFTIKNPIATTTITNTYYVTVTDSYGCKGNDSTRLIVNYPPSLSIVGLKPYICLGDSLNLYALTDYKATFLWTPNSFITSDTARSVSIYAIDTTKYYLKATTQANCSTTDSFMVNVQKPVTVTTLNPVHICYGKYTNLYASGALYYNWITKYQINDTLIHNPQISPDTSIRYWVVGSNDCFKDTGYVDVIVDTLPKVTIIKDTSIYRGAYLTLDAIYSGKSIEWHPKNLISTPFSNSIYVQPLDTTLFYAYATDGRGCIGYDSALVSVFGKNVLLIPSGFSPNGDGVNDVFKVVKYLNIKKLNKFVVYDRWGNLVFETTDINKGWDGSYKDQPVAASTYVWHIEVMTYDKEIITKDGNITLIR